MSTKVKRRIKRFTTEEPTSVAVKIEKDIKRKLEITYKKEELMNFLQPKFKEYQCFFNWVPDKKAFKNEAKTILSLISCELYEIVNENDEAELRYKATELIVKKCIHSFLCIYTRKAVNVDIILKEAEDLIHLFCVERKYISSEYMEGFFYVVRGLQLYMIITKEMKYVDLRQIERLSSEIRSYDTLSVTGQVGVLAMKQTFIGLLSNNSHINPTLILEKMIEMDPNCFQWYYYLFNIKRHERQQGTHSKYNRVDIEEIDLIVKASELAPRQPQILDSLCTCLAETVRDRELNWSGALHFGFERTFYDIESAVEFLNEETRRILAMDPMSIRENVVVAEIFSVVLPHKFRDTRMAKLCLERALMFHPNSSKTNNKMGIYCLRIEQNPKEAENFFLRSLESNRRYYPALTELIQVYLGNPSVNYQKIVDIFERELDAPYWTEEINSNLYYLKGVFHLVRNEAHDAIKSWVSAYRKNNEPLFSFQRMEYLKQYYGWSKENLTLKNIQSTLSCYSTTSKNSVVLRDIMSILLKTTCKQDSEARMVTSENNEERTITSEATQMQKYGDHKNVGSSSAKLQLGSQPKKGPHGDSMFERMHKHRRKPTGKNLTYFHRTLCVTIGSSKSDIQTAYYKICLALAEQSDKNSHLKAITEQEKEVQIEKMKQINIAYESLMD